MTRPITALVALLVIASAAASATQITILYTNDLHVRLGRLAGLAEAIAAEREQAAPVLLLDAGDTWQDFRLPLAMVRGADRMVEWMNAAGYDAMAPGNHDFVWGGLRFGRLVDAAHFPVLCANLQSIDGTSPPFAASARVRKGDLDILVIGLTTPAYFPYEDYPWLRFVDAAASLAAAVDAQAEPVDLVVCVAHLPVSVAQHLAARVPGVDLFVTGHSHEVTETPVHSGDSLIVQSGAFGHALGRLILDVRGDGAPPDVIENTLLPIEKAPIQQDRGPLRLVCILLALAATAALVLL